MALETGTYISDLVATNPTSSDSKADGDNHIRLIKSTIKASFPNVTGAVTPTHTVLNYMVGVTSAVQTQLDAKAPLASPTLTGTPLAPTAAAGTNTTQIATTAHVFAERSNTATLTNKTLTAPVINSPTGIVKGDVGLGNVDNTSDSAKPISTATQTALDLKAPLASPTFTGTPAAPTASSSTNTTQIATTAFVQAVAFNAALPAQTGNSGKFVTTDGTNASWSLVPLTTGVSGTLPVANGGSGATTLTGILKGNGTSAFTAVTAPSGALVGDTDTQTLTNKTLNSPVINTPTGLVKGDVGLGNVDNTADDTKNAAAVTLTNKTLGSGTVLGAAVTGGDFNLTRTMLIDCGAVYVDKGNSGTTTQTYDYTAGSVQKSTATGNHTVAFSNWPPTGNLGALLIEATNFGAFTVTWPTINWIKPDGSTTTSVSTWLAASTGRTAFQSSGIDWIKIWTRDGGTTLYGGFAA